MIGSIAGTREQGLAFALGAAIIALAHFAMSVLVFTGHVQSAPIWFGRFLFAARPGDASTSQLHDVGELIGGFEGGKYQSYGDLVAR